MNKEEIDDFGFTFQDDNVEQQKDKSLELFDEMVRFLSNLKGSKESNVINWPGEKRHEQIDNFINKLETILEK